MARIDLVGVAHKYVRDGHRVSADVTSDPPEPGTWALAPLTMSWEDGGAYALLGPSGCGKTTLLNIISGLATPTRGRVRFDGVDVTQLAPQSRNIAQVFQFPVVYDTMTVYDNLAFPLHNRGWARTDIRARVHEIAEILELTPDLARKARGLAADAKQKISLGRGLVRRDVAAVLFDEPLTVIDPHLKWLLRRKLRQIHEQLRVSLIYVTHDQTEAMTFADRVVVMMSGEIVQVGTPQELYDRPAHRFVGYFIGNPGMNFVDCVWQDGAVRVAGIVVRTASTVPPPDGAQLSLGIRPEDVTLADAPGPNRLPVDILSTHDRGTHTMVRGRCGDALLWIKVPQNQRATLSGSAFAHLPAERCSLYADARRVA